MRLCFVHYSRLMCKIVVFFETAPNHRIFLMWLFSLLSQFPSTKLIMPIALSLCRHDNRAIHKLIELITAWNSLRNDSLVCFFCVSNYYYIYINHQYSNGARVTDT